MNAEQMNTSNTWASININICIMNAVIMRYFRSMSAANQIWAITCIEITCNLQFNGSASCIHSPGWKTSMVRIKQTATIFWNLVVWAQIMHIWYFNRLFSWSKCVSKLLTTFINSPYTQTRWIWFEEKTKNEQILPRIKGMFVCLRSYSKIIQKQESCLWIFITYVFIE